MSEKLPVLFVHSATRPPLGADTWVHALLMRNLDRERIEVHAACVPGRRGARTPTYDALSVIPGVRLLPINLGPELFRRSRLGKVKGLVETLPAALGLRDLVRHVRRHRIRILHTSDRPRDALACALVARLTGAKYVIHVHVEYGKWMSPMLRWSMAHATALVGVSGFVARSLEAGGYAPQRIHGVPNAIDVAAWDPRLDGGAVRAELGIEPTAPVIACVARVYPAKGQAALVQAMAGVRREFPSARLLIVGQDYPEGTGHSRELRGMARQLGVAENVLFTGQRPDIAHVLSASDVFAMPSVREPFGLVYAEAMAMKRPVVALDDGGTPEVVEHQGSGLLSTEGDVNSLAAHLITLCGDPALRARMGNRGRQIVESKFTPERMARDVARIYSSL